MLIIHLILGGLLALVGWLLLVLAAPTRRCARCKGERVARSWLTGRMGGCKRCRATGRHFRRGAVLVHRVKWRIVAELRQLAAERAERRQEARP
jgi:hypothetical protein